MDRREFLKTTSGMALAFLAMNEVFGPVWQVSEAEAADKVSPVAKDKPAKAPLVAPPMPPKPACARA